MKRWLMLLALMGFFLVPGTARAEGEGFATGNPGDLLAAVASGTSTGTTEGATTTSEAAARTEEETGLEDAEDTESVGAGDDPNAELEAEEDLEDPDAVSTSETVDGYEKFGQSAADELKALAAELGVDVPEEAVLALSHEQERESAVSLALSDVRAGNKTMEQAKAELDLMDQRHDLALREARIESREYAGIQDSIKSEFPGADMGLIAQMVKGKAPVSQIKAEAQRTAKRSEQLQKIAVQKYLKEKGAKGEVIGSTAAATGGNAGESKWQDVSDLGAGELISRIFG